MRLVSTLLVLATAGITDPSQPFQAHDDCVLGAAFSPDNGTLCTCGIDGLVRVWKVERQALVTTLSGHSGPVYAAVFVKGDEMIASAGKDGTIRIWDLKLNEMKIVHRDQKRPVRCLAFAADSNKLLAGSDGGHAIEYDLVTGKKSVSILDPRDSIVDVSICPNSKKFVFTFQSGNLRVINSQTGGLARAFSAADKDSMGVIARFVNEDTIVSFGGLNGMVRTWKTDSSVAVHEIVPTRSLAIPKHGSVSKDGKLIAIIRNGSAWIECLDLASRKSCLMLDGKKSQSCVAFSPNGETLCTGDIGGGVRLWRIDQAMKADSD